MKIIQKNFQHGPVKAYRFAVHRLGRRFVPVYIYIVDGLLIDTGMSHAAKKVLAVAKSEPISQVILTHHHEDHSGNAKLLQEELGLPIYGHPLTAKIVKAGVPVLFYQKLSFGPSPSTEIFEIEGKVSTGKYEFELIETPGHCQDHYALFEAQQGWLFTGDLYIATRIKYYKSGEDVCQKIQSIKKLLRLDFDSLFCAHNPKFVGGKGKLREKLQYLEDFYGGVQQLLKKGVLPKDIKKEMNLSGDGWIKIFSSGDVSIDNMVNSAIKCT